MRVAVIHDWLTGQRGGELVLDALLELYPAADLFTLVHRPDAVRNTLRHHRGRLITSFLQQLPAGQSHYRYYLPWLPRLVERFDLTSYDLILSSSHCVAKGVRKRADAIHVSYVHAPMRYMWDRFDDYFARGSSSPLVRFVARRIRPRMQAWDYVVSQAESVDLLLANSRYIATEIRKRYGRSAQVIHPFAELSRFTRPRRPEDFYLMVGALVPYKRVDLSIAACRRLSARLLIVGGGPQERWLKQEAGAGIEFLGHRSNAQIAELYSRCRAFLLPGKEDFGIAPLEAMAAGAPVIAFGEGGALDTVTEETGRFFPAATAASLARAIRTFERESDGVSTQACRRRALQFSRARFQEKIRAAIGQVCFAAGLDRVTTDRGGHGTAGQLQGSAREAEPVPSTRGS